MKDAYIGTLIEGRAVDTVFALRSRELRCARTGDAYLAVELADRTGSIRGVRFTPSSAEQAVPVGTVVRVRGRVTCFRGVRRISIEELRPAREWDSRDFIPSGRRDSSELLEHMLGLTRRIRDPRLAAIVDEVFSEKEFMDRFSMCPGGTSGHYAYTSGLLEHTVSVAEAALRLSSWFDRVDPDLLLAAALLHDVGRVDEIEFDTSVSLSDQGLLLGHSVLSERRVSSAVQRLGDTVPDETALAVSHAILVHHGPCGAAPEGSARTLEAVVLQRADLLDAEVAAFIEATSGAAAMQESWAARQCGAQADRLLVPGPATLENPVPVTRA